MEYYHWLVLVYAIATLYFGAIIWGRQIQKSFITTIPGLTTEQLTTLYWFYSRGRHSHNPIWIIRRSWQTPIRHKINREYYGRQLGWTQGLMDYHEGLTHI